MTCTVILDDLMVIVPEENFLQSIDRLFEMLETSECDRFIAFTPEGRKICTSTSDGYLDYGED
ncbi:MAG: hypothetical protein WBA57_19130 [Elainellaceae cyanobacterium]